MKKACFCGKVTMDFPEKPLLHFMCHCTDCDTLWNGTVERISAVIEAMNQT